MAGVEQPELRTSVAGEQVWLVDYTDLAQAPDDLNQAEILGIVDHHRLGDVMTVNPLEAWIWPVGCTSTICSICSKWKMQKSHAHSRY